MGNGPSTVRSALWRGAKCSVDAGATFRDGVRKVCLQNQGLKFRLVGSLRRSDAMVLHLSVPTQDVRPSIPNNTGNQHNMGRRNFHEPEKD